jgi:hypothetical protein
MSVTFQPRECPNVDGPYGPEPQAWINFANGNAARMLDLAGLPNEPCGEAPVIDLHAVAQRLLRALNQREVYHCEDDLVQRPGPGRGAVVMCGTTEERERERLHGLLKVVTTCITLNTDLVWG